MSEPDADTTTRPSEQIMDDVVATLTAAARPDSGPDFAEFVTLAVAAAVANVGGAEAPLSHRSGSWEAERVREMLLSTVGEDPDTLLGHGTEALVFDVYPDPMLSGLGYWRLYDEAEAELDRRYDALACLRPCDTPTAPTRAT